MVIHTCNFFDQKKKKAEISTCITPTTITKPHPTPSQLIQLQDKSMTVGSGVTVQRQCRVDAHHLFTPGQETLEDNQQTWVST
jgi:hypothetical protein